MDRLSGKMSEQMTLGEAVALVRVTTAKGSAPREAGAHMVVTATGSFGTIGGGRLEWEAIEAARRLLAQGEATISMALPLGPALGQCCGGHVSLRIDRADSDAMQWLESTERRDREVRPQVLLFGAGHVGRALANALAPLPMRLRWIDSRVGEFPVPPPAGVEIVTTDMPLDEIARAPAGAAGIVMTHSHALDYELVEAMLCRDDFAYVGLIGSVTKRRRFQLRFVGRGNDKRHLARLVCPIGGGRVADKRPAVIAAMAAAEIMDYLLAVEQPADARMLETGRGG